jgi:hypothetical protein
MINTNENSGNVISLPSNRGTAPSVPSPKRNAGKVREYLADDAEGDDRDSVEVQLLANVTKAAKAFLQAGMTFKATVEECEKAGIDRDDVLEAALAGGIDEGTARNTVSSVYNKAGKRVKAKGQGRKANPHAAEMLALIKKSFPALNGKDRASAILAAYKLDKANQEKSAGK